jgi:hypothetical protein
MWGQWYGGIDGYKLTVLLNVDRQCSGLGRVHVFEPGAQSPYVSATVDWSGDPSAIGTFLIDDLNTPLYGKTGTFKCTEFSPQRLRGVVHVSGGKPANVDLFAIDEFTTHSIAYSARSWEQLVHMLGQQPLNGSRMIFRGQRDKRWYLESKFHRLGRRDLRKYQLRDVEELRRLLAGMGHDFNTSDPASLESLIHLGQHHAFPTPWLDWTESAYIALYFAFEQPSLPRSEDEFARLYAIDVSEWPYTHLSVPRLEGAVPYVEISKPLPTQNQRAVSQQAIVMATNIARPEWYISNYARPNGAQPKLAIVEIPWLLRTEVLRELARMNIGPRQIHGGFDGIGLELAQRYFDPPWDH